MVAELEREQRFTLPTPLSREVMCSWKEMTHAVDGPLKICPLSVVMGRGRMGFLGVCPCQLDT